MLSLQVSFVGYKAQDVSLKGQSKYQGDFGKDTEVLDKLLLSGYGSVEEKLLDRCCGEDDAKSIQDRP